MYHAMVYLQMYSFGFLSQVCLYPADSKAVTLCTIELL